MEYYTDFNDYNSAYRREYVPFFCLQFCWPAADSFLGRTVERMREHGIVLTPYLDRALLERIYGPSHAEWLI